MSRIASMSVPTTLGLVTFSLWVAVFGYCAYHEHHGQLVAVSFISLVLIRIAYFLLLRNISLRFRRAFLISVYVVEVLAFALFLCACFHTSHKDRSSVELASVSIPPGSQIPISSSNKLILRLGADDILPAGPLSFDVDSYGTSYISDSEGRKILVFDDKGALRKNVPLPFQPGRILLQKDESFFLLDAITGQQYEAAGNGSGVREIEGTKVESVAPQPVLRILGTDSFYACDKTARSPNVCTYKFTYSGRELVGLSFLGSLSDHRRVCFDLQVAEHNRPETVLRFVTVYDEHGALVSTIGPLFNGYDYPLIDDLRINNDRLYQLRISENHVYMDHWSLP
jgi:hypothetical protein